MSTIDERLCESLMMSNGSDVCLLIVASVLLLYANCRMATQDSDTWINSFQDNSDMLTWNVCLSRSNSPSPGTYLAVVDSRRVYRLRSVKSLSLSSVRGRHTKCELVSLKKQFMSIGSHAVALYTEQTVGEEIELVDLRTVTKSHTQHRTSSDGKTYERINLVASTKPLVGILYSTWHAALGAGEMQECAKVAKSKNSTCPTTEYVIRNSDAGPDSIRIRNLSSGYNVTPKKGFYCIYRKRPGEAGLLPDCPNITETLTQHASELLSAGIDFVALDATNLDQWPDNHSDTIQLRPTEVLFEEWAKLRESGGDTPKIVVWNLATNVSVLWKQYLERLYNNPNKYYQDLLVINKWSGKKIFMVPDSGRAPAPEVVSAIESNGGRNDVEVIKVWALLPIEKYSSGTWGFFTPCGGKSYSTTVQSMTECNQVLTSNSPMGTAIAVSPSYQTGYASAPFQSPSALGGFTFKIQFATALKQMPDNFFVSSYNEFITGPQHNAFGGPDKWPWITSVGLEYDPDRYSGWVDTFGAYRSRNIEPTEEYGDLFYSIMSSCFRILSLNAAANKTGCNVMGEECCDVDNSRQYKPIWSLRTVDSVPLNKTDFLLTDSESERDQKTGPLGGYREICAAIGPDVKTFCFDGSLAQNIDAARGPFILFSQSGANRAPLYRCTGASAHYFSKDKGCEDLGKMESLLGWTSSRRDSETARSLHRCQARDENSNHTYYFPLLDNSCPQGTVDDKIMGYVV